MFGSLFVKTTVEIEKVAICPGTSEMTVIVTRSPRFGSQPPTTRTYLCQGSASDWRRLDRESGDWLKFPRWVQREINQRIVEMAMRESWKRSAPALHNVASVKA